MDFRRRQSAQATRSPQVYEPVGQETIVKYINNAFLSSFRTLREAIGSDLLRLRLSAMICARQENCAQPLTKLLITCFTNYLYWI